TTSGRSAGTARWSRRRPRSNRGNVMRVQIARAHMIQIAAFAGTAILSAGCSQMAGVPGFGGRARARSNEDQNYRAGLKSLSDLLKHPAPGPGLETAHPSAAGWCTGIEREANPWDPGRAGRTYGDFLAHGYWTSVLRTAKYQCQADQSDPVVQQLNAELVQDWINILGQSERDAIASIAVRLRPDQMEAGKQKVCAALAISDEVLGEDRTLMTARRAIFNCDFGSNEFEGLWSPSARLDADVVAVLDQSSQEPDELVRLAYVVVRTKGTNRLPDYGVDSIDFRALSDGKVRALLTAPPYACNAYAAALGSEALAVARQGIAARDAEAKAKLGDADWREV